MVKTAGINSVFDSGVRLLDPSDYDKGHYCADGSWRYDSKILSLSDVEVENCAKEYVNNDMGGGITKSADIDAEFKDDLFKTLNYLLEKGVKIDFFLCPYQPLIYERAKSKSDLWHIILDTEVLIREYAEKNNLSVIGSFNPLVNGCDESDFFDARHFRYESLKEKFDFTE